MKKSDIYEIAVKVLGLYLFFNLIVFLRELFTSFTLMVYAKENNHFDGFNNTQLFILSLVYIIVIFLFASFIVFKSKNIVKFICKPSDYEETTSLFVDRKVIYEIAIVLMGLILIAWTTPEFVVRLKFYILKVQRDLLPNGSDFDISLLWTSAIKIVLGIFAVIYANTISGFLSREKKVVVNEE